MCDICDGATWGEVLLRTHLAIAEVGWSYTAVTGGPGASCWTYTVGLTSTFDHPELVVTGVTPDVAARLLEALCLRIKDGDRLVDGAERTVGAVRLVEVHPAQLEPTLADWVRYYGALGEPLTTLRALQVVVPRAWFCGSHAVPQPLLDKAWPIFAWEGTNRAGRRAVHRNGRSGRSRPRRW